MIVNIDSILEGTIYSLEWMLNTFKTKFKEEHMQEGRPDTEIAWSEEMIVAMDLLKELKDIAISPIEVIICNKSAFIPQQLDTLTKAQTLLNTLLSHSQIQIIGFVYDPCGNRGVLWSVDVLTKSGESFEQPFGANTFLQCIQIAFIEGKKRGWINNESDVSHP